MINYDSIFLYDDPLLTYDGTLTVQVTATAPLGALTATAQSTSPQPEQHYGSNGYVPIKKKQKKEKPSPVIVVEITEVPELEPLIKSHFSFGSSDFFGLLAQAENRIDFSIVQDEADLLLIL